MGRKLYYFAEDNSTNTIRDNEWEEICRLQKWYNSEFIWSCGRLALKMYAVFPNWDYLTLDTNTYWAAVKKRARDLRRELPTENEVTRVLEREKLVVVKKGGYLDGSIASGFTKVAGNEFNAYLVCDFFLKVSRIARDCTFMVRDEGGFIKCREVSLKNGRVRVTVKEGASRDRVIELVQSQRVFSIVDSTKYDNFPRFKTTVVGFDEMDQEERREFLKDWNWLGFSGTYDSGGDDLRGYDLNEKVDAFELAQREF